MVLEEVLLAQAFDFALERFQKAKEENQKTVTLVKFDESKASLTILGSATTVKTEFDSDNVDLTIENPYKTKCYVKEISIIPDDLFRTKGMIEVKIGDELFFYNLDFGDFAKIPETVIKSDGNGEPIKANESVMAYLKSSDGSSVGVALQVTFGE